MVQDFVDFGVVRAVEALGGAVFESDFDGSGGFIEVIHFRDGIHIDPIHSVSHRYHSSHEE